MTDALIQFDKVVFRYDPKGPDVIKAIDLGFERGSFVAVLGHNGSGKSTLAKLMNGLFLPSEGTVTVDGMATSDETKTWDIRRRAGMVFQNPDNQIVATMVREDVAFGLENTGVPTEDMPALIDEALAAVDMSAFASHAPHLLSGGQKQRVAIAGVLAMRPDALILDEATAMLDPAGRREVFQTVRRLNKERGMTVIWITHFMEEAALSDRVVVMHEGTVIMDDGPRQVFSQLEKLRDHRLDVPPMTNLANIMADAGLPVDRTVLTVDEMEKEVLRLAHHA